jgi:hypothetical protein
MSVARQTAAAFGDEPDRDVEAEFGASLSSALKSVASAAKGVASTVKAPAPSKSSKSSSVSVSASVKAPKLAVMAPPVPAPPKPAAKASVAVSQPVKAGGKAAVVARPVTAVKPPGATTTYAAAANQANFLDGGGAPLSTTTVKVPAGTKVMTQAERDANARALLKEKTLATAVRNAPALNQKRTDTYETMKAAGVFDNIRQPWEKAGVDWGLIPMGAKVLATGAAVIASGGAVAGALGVTAAGGSLAAAAAADRLVAAVERGGELGKQAKDVIDDVKSAAARGDKVAKDALAVVDSVASGRVAAGVKAGVEQTLTAAGRAAVDQVAGVAGALSGSGSLDLGRALATAAASGAAAPSSGGFVDLRPQRQVTVVSNRPVGGVVASLLGRGEPRWLVTPEARVVDLERTPSKATARGFLVSTTGEVSKQ